MSQVSEFEGEIKTELNQFRGEKLRRRDVIWLFIEHAVGERFAKTNSRRILPAESSKLTSLQNF